MCYARRQRSSWARIKLSKILYRLRLSAVTTFSSYSFLASFTLLSIYNSFWRDLYFALALYALYFSLVVQFSMTVPPALADSLTIIPHSWGLVNTFLKSFLRFFWILFGCSPIRILFYLFFLFPLLRRLVYYTPFITLCQYFFSKKSNFFHHFVFCQKSNIRPLYFVHI